MTAILIIDDEPAVRRLLRRFLESEAYTVYEAGSGIEAVELVKHQPVDLVTLDLALDGEDGLDLARQLRGVCDAAIIMITGKDGLIDRVVGLEIGADDYITKPFELREVLARVRAVLRRSARSGAPSSNSSLPASTGDAPTHTPLPAVGPDDHYRFSDCTLDIKARELRDAAGAPVLLTTAEFELLHLFLRRARQVLSRDCIMDALRGTDWHPNDRSIDNNVARLRRKLEKAGVDKAIRTVRSVGYQFIGDCRDY